MAEDVLQDVMIWRLKREKWDEILRGLETMQRALAAEDSAGFRQAVADIEMAGPHRITGLEDAATLPLPEEHRERVNQLVHTLGEAPDEASCATSDAKTAGTNASG